MKSKAIGCVVAACTLLAPAAQPVLARETEGEEAAEWAEKGWSVFRPGDPTAPGVRRLTKAILIVR